MPITKNGQIERKKKEEQDGEEEEVKKEKKISSVEVDLK